MVELKPLSPPLVPLLQTGTIQSPPVLFLAASPLQRGSASLELSLFMIQITCVFQMLAFAECSYSIPYFPMCVPIYCISFNDLIYMFMFLFCFVF